MATNTTITGYKTYVTKEGDAFDLLALREYGEETMSKYIINANLDYCDVLIFDAGVTLKIPILTSVDIPSTLPPWRRGS